MPMGDKVADSPSKMIDARTAEGGDRRATTLARPRTLIKQADPGRAAVAHNVSERAGK